MEEIELAGVVSARWMFFFERFMGVMKTFVRQRARPEGSIAEGWLHLECMYYVTEYLQSTHSQAPALWKANEPIHIAEEVLCGIGVPLRLKAKDQENLSTFLCYNTECMQKWIKAYEEKKAQYLREHRKRKRVEEFPYFIDWLKAKVFKAATKGKEIPQEEKEMMYGCDKEVGFCYHYIEFVLCIVKFTL